MNNLFENNKNQKKEDFSPDNDLTEDKTENITNNNNVLSSPDFNDTEITTENNDNTKNQKKSKKVTFSNTINEEIKSNDEIKPDKDKISNIDSIEEKEIKINESSNQIDADTSLVETTNVTDKEVKDDNNITKNENEKEKIIEKDQENIKKDESNNNINDTEIIDNSIDVDKKNEDWDGNGELIKNGNGKKKIILKLNNDNGGNPSDVQNNLLELEVDQLNNIEQIRFIIKIANNTQDQYMKYGFVSKYNFTSKYHIIHVDQHVRLPSHFTKGKIRANEIKSSQNLINMQRKRHLYTMAILNNANIINIMDIDGLSNVNHITTVKLKEKLNKYILLEKIGHYAACYNNTVVEVNYLKNKKKYISNYI